MSDELPKGWATARISDVTEHVPNIKPEDSPGKEFGYVDISSIDNSSFVITDVKRFKGKDAPSRARRPIRPNDIVFSNVRTYLRNIALVDQNCAAGVCSTGFTVLRPNAAVEPRFLFRYVLTKQFLDRVTPQQTGTHYPATSDKVVISEEIPLAPLAEQRRIVAKLETLLGKVDASQQRLAKIPVLLKRFRQSVLAAACSGRLTADWREENDSPEPASELLARLSKERERKATTTAGKRRVPPVPLDVDGLPDLPELWQWATLDQIVEEGRPIIYGIIKPGPHDPHGVPYVRVFEMKDGKVVSLAELKRAALERASKFTRATLKAGDVLISKDGTIGRVAIVPPELEGGNITQHLVRASVHPFLNREFVAHTIRAKRSQDWLVGEKKGVALQGVNVEDFRRLPLPIAPLPEQQEIVRRVEGLFALADQLEERLAKARGQVEKLTPSLLALSFAGQLVPQDPTDEPAEKLLERISKTQSSNRD